MKNLKIVLVLLLLSTSMSCKKYLDVIPDNIPTIENAFSSRTTAEKYLFTCFMYMPSHASVDNVGFLTGDEFWLPYPQVAQFHFFQSFEDIARDRQSMVDPTLNYWDGTKGGKALFQGIRDCNIFLENIGKVPGMQEREKNRWIAEVKFLKAYYHFWLLRMYGPIPLIKENLPVSASPEEVKVKRAPVDECFDYVVELLNEAIPDLPPIIENESSENGRITQPIALSVKAQILVTAASPLFNGNQDMANFRDKDNTQLFNPTPSTEKWTLAAEAAKAAIDACHAAGARLNVYAPVVNTFGLSDTTLIQMSIRNSVTEKWNPEVIWANTNSMAIQIQALSQAFIDPTKTSNMGARSMLAPTLEIAELFYTNNGVPINEDNSWDYAGRYTVKTATVKDRFNLQTGYKTASLHMNRENRFYADLGFDGGVWYGQGKYDDKQPWFIEGRTNQTAGKRGISLYSATGYWSKKLVNFQNIIEAGDGGPYTIKPYPWPVIRLAEVYLLYAEALNESAGPSPEVYNWINLVRARAGLQSVEKSWSEHSRIKDKYLTQNGLRSIIQQERQIELAFEGQRFWDIMRWKKGREEFNGPIKGWDIDQEAPENYYRVRTLFNKKFSNKDYFWPISENNLVVNNNLVQNPGW